MKRSDECTARQMTLNATARSVRMKRDVAESYTRRCARRRVVKITLCCCVAGCSQKACNSDAAAKAPQGGATTLSWRNIPHVAAAPKRGAHAGSGRALQWASMIAPV